MFPILDWISRFFARERRRSAALSEISILCVLNQRHDESLIRETCREHGWIVSFAPSLDHAQRLLSRFSFPIILLDRELAGGEWREAMARLAEPSGALCILLVPKIFDDHLWNEVVRHGGYDILPKPLRPPDLARAVRLAWSYWIGVSRRAAISRS